MAKTMKEAPITTASGRSKLTVGQYKRYLDADSTIWFRKGKRGGKWFARWRNTGPGANYKQEEVGAANDLNDKITEGVLTFQQAETQARKIVAEARQAMKAKADGPVLTVRLAVEEYIAGRDAREQRRREKVVRSDANRRLSLHVLSSEIATVELHALKEKDLHKWRSKLSDELKATTKQRLTNDFKAALNTAYSDNRERLNAELPSIIKHGLKADRTDEETDPVARENQILSDAQVSRLLQAARALDEAEGWEGDLFRMVVVLAATGARFSQVSRMCVSDCQRLAGRLLVPVSRKGRGRKSGTVPVPVGKDVLDVLLPATTGRKNHAPLFERWRHHQVKGGISWERKDRGPWSSSSELTRPWAEIRQLAELPDAIPYALRHSSIVRGIRANLPIRLVAGLHDTSVAMIERHYGRWIADGLEELVARAIVPLVPAGESRVVQLRGGA